ncbi:MAG: hypothetical protein FWD66_01110 [Paludibacter sp.]|nr:hypothetical protein [Paludibacter sp.]
MIDRLLDLQKGKGQFSPTMKLPEYLKKEISILYKHFFGKIVTGGCNNCYHDAYLQLLLLNSLNIIKMTTNFKLKAGAILEAHGDPTKTCANSNLTDELAIFHLKNNPSCRRKFEKVPENLDEILRVGKIVTPQSKTSNNPTDTGKIEKQNEGDPEKKNEDDPAGSENK